MEKLIKAYGFRGFLMVFSGFFLFNIIIWGGGLVHYVIFRSKQSCYVKIQEFHIPIYRFQMYLFVCYQNRIKIGNKLRIFCHII